MLDHRRGGDRMAFSRSWVTVICALYALIGNVKAHTYISYPGWRGNNLGITDEYPFGMQRGYPCECHCYFSTDMIPAHVL